MNTSVSPTRHWKRIDWRYVGLVVLGLLGSAMVSYLAIIDEVRPAFALTFAFTLVSLSVLRIQWAIAATLVYLVFLGDLRRWLIPVADWSGSDPLLLIGPVFAIAIFAYAWASRDVQLDTPLAWWVLALMAIMALQVFNPRQGGLLVGIGGVMFKMIPLFWFWIGRTYLTPGFFRTLLYRVIVPLSVLAMLLGFYQLFYGYLPYQMEWYRIAGYSSLGNLSTGLTPLSFFASATEHVTFLSVALMALWAIGLKKNKGALLLSLIIFICLMVTGVRGPVFKSLLVGAGLWAILGKTQTAWITRGTVALLIAGVGLVWSLQQVSQMNLNPAVQGRIDRQAQEFVDRGGEEQSSMSIHLTLMAHGYASALRNPLGYGLGAGTKAASRLGGSNVRGAHSTETDLGNSFLALGVPGGVVYHIIVFLIILTGFKYWYHTRSTRALAILGILGVTFMLWLGGGMYAVNPIIWVCVGALDRFYRDEVQAGEKVNQ